MLKRIPVRVWILVMFLVFSLFAINPSPGAEGIEVKSVEPGGALAQQGIKAGHQVMFVNNERIDSLEDFERALAPFASKPQNITVGTEMGSFSYEIIDSFGFEVDENLTVLEVEDFCPIEYGDVIRKVGAEEVSDPESLNRAIDGALPKRKLVIKTDKGEFAMLVRGRPEMTAGMAEKSNLKLGLDLRGGTRVLLQPVAESGDEITDADIGDIISVLNNRLNVYGLSDLRIRSAKDWAGNKFVLIEIAGATREEVKDLIGKQGKFEAKIGNETVFIGGKKDITFVCRGDGSCSGIRNCNQAGPNSWACKFEFSIHLSPEAAKKHANVTKDLEVELSTDGREILSERIDFYLDDRKVDSLQISADLKGVETTAIAISGPGTGSNRASAAESAIKNMDKLQTILITGSLPFKLNVEKLDTISPSLGRNFLSNALLVGLLAIISVSLVVTLRYRNVKIIAPMVFTCLSEVFLILGFAALIEWNLDIVSIAGIIAAVGTGVDDQIIIVDEVIKGKHHAYYSWTQRVKRAFFIIMAAYATTVAAMIPLWNAGAGLIRGFAITTIVGVTIGVFITRPAFAAIIEKWIKE